MKRVLFVCIGNTCRSPMAEGFANHYGNDVLIAMSRGLSPTLTLAAPTVEVMAEKNIDVSGHVPQRFDPMEASTFDIVVNISGYELPGPRPRDLREWPVRDPYRRPLDVYRASANDLEQRVMLLILELRRTTGM